MNEKVKQVIKDLYERHNFKYDESKDLYSKILLFIIISPLNIIDNTSNLS